MLEIRALTKRYRGLAAVQNVSFNIAPGEILGYLGPNGSGKSTTVKSIVGLVEPSEGQILFEGRSILDDLPGFQRRIGYVPEEAVLYPYMTGSEYLQLAGRLHGIPQRRLDPKIEKFLRLFSLYDDRHAPIHTYSKGMRQKILISAALLHNPEVLILDEPLSGLDVTSVLLVKELMRGLAAQGRYIFYSSHVLEIVEKVCARVLILSKGRVMADGAVGELRERLHEESLEGVFAQLTGELRTHEAARHILEVMQA